MTRHFITVEDLSPQEFVLVLDNAARWKKEGHGTPLAGKTVALIFGKPSTRTRVSFSVGVHQLGGMPLYLSEHEIQMRRSESIEDTARVLSRFVDGIVIRTFANKDVEDLAVRAGVDVGPNRGQKVDSLVASLVELGVDLWVLTEVLRDGMVIDGPLELEFAGHRVPLCPFRRGPAHGFTPGVIILLPRSLSNRGPAQGRRISQRRSASRRYPGCRRREPAASQRQRPAL